MNYGCSEGHEGEELLVIRANAMRRIVFEKISVELFGQEVVACGGVPLVTQRCKGSAGVTQSSCSTGRGGRPLPGHFKNIFTEEH